MSEANENPSAATGLAGRLATAALSTASAREAVVGRCSVPVAVDAWGAVSERCPLRPGHGDEHEIESEPARQERLERAAALDAGRVLDAAGAVVAWLAEASGSSGSSATTALPPRELWTLVDVAEASAMFEALPPRAAAGREEVATDA